MEFGVPVRVFSLSFVGGEGRGEEAVLSFCRLKFHFPVCLTNSSNLVFILSNCGRSFANRGSLNHSLTTRSDSASRATRSPGFGAGTGVNKFSDTMKFALG